VREGDAAFEALREAMDAFAAERAPELVAEAQAEAVAKVRSMLAEAMAQSLLDHSAANLSAARQPTHPESPSKRPSTSRRTPSTGKRAAPKRRPARPKKPPIEPARRQAPEPSRDAGELGYYVYGVVSVASGRDLPADLIGVDSRSPATLVEGSGLAAIVSRVSLAEFGEEQLHDNLNDVAWLEDKARAHEEVLDAALSRMTVVPMRLCTIYRSEDQVQEMLGRERDLLVDALARLQGKTEWGVKVIAEPGALERAAAQGGARPDDEAKLSPGTAYMSEKRRQALSREEGDRVAEEWAEAVHERLAAKASEALLNPLQNPEVSGHIGEMLLNGVYLVDDREAEDFRGVVDQLAGEYLELGAAVELTGPWPPYNFVKSSIEAAR